MIYYEEPVEFQVEPEIIINHYQDINSPIIDKHDEISNNYPLCDYNETYMNPFTGQYISNPYNDHLPQAIL